MEREDLHFLVGNEEMEAIVLSFKYTSNLRREEGSFSNKGNRVSTKNKTTVSKTTIVTFQGEKCHTSFATLHQYTAIGSC